MRWHSGIVWLFIIGISIFSVSLVLAQEPGSLLWKSSVGWYVHEDAPTGDIDGDGFPDLFLGSGDNIV